MSLLNTIQEFAIKANKKIVLPEGYEERTLQAADKVLEKKISQIILIGNPNELIEKAKNLNLKNIDKAEIIDPVSHSNKEKYVNMMVELRKHKGLTKEDATNLIENPLYLATLIIKAGDADGEVAGADNATGDVLRPAFQFIKTLPGYTVVSGAFIMILKDDKYGEDGMLVFADCAVHPDPNAEELAQIAVATGRTTRAIAKFEPKIAMLSFSTKGSAKHHMVDKVTQATEIAQKMDSSMQIDGELQADAALVEAIGKKKSPGSSIAGKANVLVFPDLQSGNISYKLVQRLAGAEAIGPILQGLAAPINDLSRGCSVDDIVNLIAITANQANG